MQLKRQVDSRDEGPAVKGEKSSQLTEDDVYLVNKETLAHIQYSPLIECLFKSTVQKPSFTYLKGKSDLKRFAHLFCPLFLVHDLTVHFI